MAGTKIKADGRKTKANRKKSKDQTEGIKMTFSKKNSLITTC
jgi:hypothetical protein